MVEKIHLVHEFPVATWWLHGITELPMCWLFREDKPESGYVAFTYDGTTYRVYEGDESGRLPVVARVAVYGRPWENPDHEPVEADEKEGVEIVVMKDGRLLRSMRISSGDAGVATYDWCRIDTGLHVSMLRMPIDPYRIVVHPERISLTERKAHTCW